MRTTWTWTARRVATRTTTATRATAAAAMATTTRTTRVTARTARAAAGRQRSKSSRPSRRCAPSRACMHYARSPCLVLAHRSQMARRACARVRPVLVRALEMPRSRRAHTPLSTRHPPHPSPTLPLAHPIPSPARAQLARLPAQFDAFLNDEDASVVGFFAEEGSALDDFKATAQGMQVRVRRAASSNQRACSAARRDRPLRCPLLCEAPSAPRARPPHPRRHAQTRRRDGATAARSGTTALRIRRLRSC